MTPEEAQLETWFRMPLEVRVLLAAAVGFGLAFVVANLDRLYNGYSGSLVGLLVWAGPRVPRVDGRQALISQVS